MHRAFREKLDSAKGVSEFVIALNIDIRGFSDWSLEVDSAQTALYIKKLYAKLIDKYFAEAAFVKPTGDGLLVVLNFEEEQVADAVAEVVRNSIEIVRTFGSLCDNEPAINFDVPKDVGIGISRGAASRLTSDDLTLDYSGRVLNLASRLMDIARPKGVVFDSQLGVQLLPKELKSKFKARKIYLKGVAPRTPLDIRCWPKSIQPPPVNLSPIGEPRWEHVEYPMTVSDLDEEDAIFALDLPSHPPDPATLTCEVSHDAVTPKGARSAAFLTQLDVPVKYIDAAGNAQASLDQSELAQRLKEGGVGAKWPVLIKVSYRTA